MRKITGSALAAAGCCAAVALTLALAPAAPASAFWMGPTAVSRAVTEPPTIDGKADDWRLDPEAEHEGIAYGFAHDAHYLYAIFVPHTREAKEQLTGLYQQDVMLWLDRAGGKARLAGLKILAPAQLGETARALELVRVSTASAGGAEPAAAVGPMEGRGAFELRVPLAWLGAPPPRRFTVGLEALTPRRPPALPEQRRSRDVHEAPPAPRFEPVVLWVRVDLPK